MLIRLSGYSGQKKGEINILKLFFKVPNLRKTNLVGKKPRNSGNQKRRARLPEPELFEEKIIEEEPNEQVTPVKIRRIGNEVIAWQVAYYKILKF